MPPFALPRRREKPPGSGRNGRGARRAGTATGGSRGGMAEPGCWPLWSQGWWSGGSVTSGAGPCGAKGGGPVAVSPQVLVPCGAATAPVAVSPQVLVPCGAKGGGPVAASPQVLAPVEPRVVVRWQCHLRCWSPVEPRVVVLWQRHLRCWPLCSQGWRSGGSVTSGAGPLWSHDCPCGSVTSGAGPCGAKGGGPVAVSPQVLVPCGASAAVAVSPQVPGLCGASAPVAVSPQVPGPCGARAAVPCGGVHTSVKTMISNMEQDLEVFQDQAVAKASPCEAELQELVHQIDIMVNSKKVEWERKMKALEAKMDIQEQELASAQSKLDQKGQEVGLLRQKLEDLQKTKYEMAQNYETQLQALKSQFSKLTHSYEKLQSHQLKQKKFESREKCEESLETPSELSNLYKKLEEFKAKSREWDKKGTICQNYLVYLGAQQKLLSEKCNLFQKQTQNYEFQRSNKKQNKEEVITYGQPKSEKDELIIEKLKATVNEIAINKNKLEEENLKLREDLKMYQNQCQHMEADFSEMRDELQSRDALWRRIQLECQQLHAELLKIREYEDMQEIQIKHQSSCVQLTEQLENKNAELLLLAQSQEHQREELNKIRNHLYREEQSHRSEQERMKTEISDLTEELHQKEITIATIMEKASLLERQLKMELEIKDKLLAKQQLLDFQYKVIQSENTHLKEMVENQECKSCTSIDLSDKEHGNFTTSVNNLEHENVRLQNSLVKLQSDTETSMLGRMDTYGETEHSYQTHSKTQEKEERTFRKKDAWEIERQHTSMFTASGYHRNCSPVLYGQGNIIGSKSDSALSSHTLHRGREKKIDDKSPSAPMGDLLGFGGPFPEKGRTGSLVSAAYNGEESKLSYPPEMSFLATIEKFLQEEERHTREFEERLNSYLEELQRHSENTLKKYAGIQQSRHT
ncbi:deuterosome assembly protein 1 [Pluvialis apricaria]